MSAALYRITIDALAAGATTRMEVVAHVARVGVLVSHEDVRAELLRAEAAGCVVREGNTKGTKWRLA